MLKCPTTGLHVEDVSVEGEEWNGKGNGKGKGKARAVCARNEVVGGNGRFFSLLSVSCSFSGVLSHGMKLTLPLRAAKTNAINNTTDANCSSLLPSASASASASASNSQDDFAPYCAYIDSQFSSRTWEKDEAASSAGSTKSSAKRSTPGTSLGGEAASKAAAASASAVKLECEVEGK